MNKMKISVLYFLTAAVLFSGCAAQQRTERPPAESSSVWENSSYITKNYSDISSSLETDSYFEAAADPAYSSSSVSSSETPSSSVSSSSASSSEIASSSAVSSPASSSKPASSSTASSPASSSKPANSSAASSPTSSSSDPTEPYVISEQCDLNGHTVVIDKGVVPTCQAKGLTQGAHCTVCGKVLNAQHEIEYYHIYLLSDIEYPSEGTEGQAEFTCTGSPSEVYRLNFTSIPTEREVYDVLISFKSKYPDRTAFTNSVTYNTTKLFHNVVFTGKGCAAFAAELSDAAFGEWPARITFDFSNIRVGDMIRLQNSQHSVIVLAVDGDKVTVAEANYNGSVRWGRTLSLSNARTEWNYIITRYPE